MKVECEFTPVKGKWDWKFLFGQKLLDFIRKQIRNSDKIDSDKGSSFLTDSEE